MSDDEFLCEYCGHSSHDETRCTYCGHVLEPSTGQYPPFRIPLWGRLRIQLQNSAATDRTWEFVDELWRTKVQRRWPSADPHEMSKRDLGAGVLEFTGPDFMIEPLEEALQANATITFEELPPEEYPKSEVPYKFPRPPTVPRGKRKP